MTTPPRIMSLKPLRLYGPIFATLLAWAPNLQADSAKLPGKKVHTSFFNEIKKEALIQLAKYDPKMDAFKINVIGEDGVGPLYATPENVSKCIPLADPATLRQRPSQFMNTQYQLETALPLLSLDEQNARGKVRK